jgi:hypothetical protein
MIRSLSLASAAAFLLGGSLFVGCSDKSYVEVAVHPVKGTLHTQGEPLYGAYLTFHPQGDVGMTKGNKPFARVEQDGSFQVTTYDTSDGAPAGSYAVTIYWPEDPESRGFSPDRLKEKFANPEKPAFEISIGDESTQLPPWELP